MKEILFSYFIIQFILVYCFSIGSFFAKIINSKFNILSKILIGYSIVCLILFYLYFFLKIENKIIIYIILVSTPVLFIDFKKYYKNFFLNKINILISIILFFFLFIAIFYGEQFYVFRGNNWDSFNYLTSALLFKNHNYSEILNNSFPEIYLQFRELDSIVTGRPIVNYLLSFFINNKINIFLSYYLFKILLTILVFISLKDFIDFFFKKNTNLSYIIAFGYIFSFWNIYVFEIDALSHLASIPILILLIKHIFNLFDKLSENDVKNFLFVSILSSTLFIIYPEVIILPALIFLVLMIEFFLKLNFKILLNFLFSFVLFIILTSPSIETNYKYLFTSQLNQALRLSDWWGYFGSFMLGRDNLVLNIDFVKNLENIIASGSFYNILSYIHSEHFQNKYYFIYLNIFPSLTGLYYLLPGKIESYLELFYQSIILLTIYIYILKIFVLNTNYLLSLNNYKNFYKKLFFLILCLIIFLLYHQNFWTIIKLFTFIFPFIFIFFVVNLSNQKTNKIYMIFMVFFFFYKYSTFNNGIGRLDSFPSIIDPELKTKVNWNINRNSLENCSNIHFDEKNYFKKAYIYLKYINLDLKNEKVINNVKVCKIIFVNNNFKIIYE